MQTLNILLIIIGIVSLFGLAANIALSITYLLSDKTIERKFRLMVYWGTIPLMLMWFIGAITLINRFEKTEDTPTYKQGFQDGLHQNYEEVPYKLYKKR